MAIELQCALHFHFTCKWMGVIVSFSQTTPTTTNTTTPAPCVLYPSGCTQIAGIHLQLWLELLTVNSLPRHQPPVNGGAVVCTITIPPRPTLPATSQSNWKRSISAAKCSAVPTTYTIPVQCHRPFRLQVDDFIAHFITLNTMRINPHRTHEIKISPFVVHPTLNHQHHPLWLMQNPKRNTIIGSRTEPPPASPPFTLHAIFKHNLFQFVAASTSSSSASPTVAFLSMEW